ncbi:TetR/AcrR family transcriptional regulator [Microbacterium sp. p3-SID336]|uniref:TetR/AcrR family transcriptional regulator n=1 Tax=Microbacterium sp. p3-SID336 TaxID=2916212 RepID=UPI0021A689D7|nr:TetR/AcrR family transcriptional regulator [Microbacterium sp. p3-SID336]MCT1477791.1 TetR/AcrR family transcriptional regulator [Microbacterium sp. p3-SID336]
MSTSAESSREQRKRATTRALTETARRLTTERGFAGFTIEELCAEVGVSRRTFFNYFESKENAVFGFAVIDSGQERLEEDFIAAKGDLVDDFVALTIARFALFDPIEHAAELFAVIEQEPRLLKAAFEQQEKHERRDIGLILRRTGDAGDAELRAEVLVQSVGALVRLCMEQLLHHHSTEPFAELITRRLQLARELYAPSQKAH